MDAVNVQILLDHIHSECRSTLNAATSLDVSKRCCAAFPPFVLRLLAAGGMSGQKILACLLAGSPSLFKTFSTPKSPSARPVSSQYHASVEGTLLQHMLERWFEVRLIGPVE